MEQAMLAGANEILQEHNTPPAKLVGKILKLHEGGGEIMGLR